MSDLLEEVDSGDVAALVLLDLSAAFATVDHSILCHLWIGWPSSGLVPFISSRSVTVHLAWHV